VKSRGYQEQHLMMLHYIIDIQYQHNLRLYQGDIMVSLKLYIAGIDITACLDRFTT